MRLGNNQWGKTHTKKLMALFPRLESLDFGTCKKASHHHKFTDLKLPNFPLLTSFEYTWCYDAGPESMIIDNILEGRAAVLKKLVLHRMEGMTMTQTFAVTDLFLDKLATCPNLEHLSLEGALAFTDDAVQRLAAACPKLKVVMLQRSMIFFERFDFCKAIISPRLTDASKATLAHVGTVHLSGWHVV